MKRTNADGATIDNKFTDGDEVEGVEATEVEETWLNNVQEELCNVVEGAGITLDGSVQTQLRAALEKYAFGGRSGPLSKVFSDSGFTASQASRVVTWSTASGSCVQNLPALAGVVGSLFIIAKTSSDANTVTVTPNGAEKINEDSTLVLSTQDQACGLLALSSKWLVVF